MEFHREVCYAGYQHLITYALFENHKMHKWKVRVHQAKEIIFLWGGMDSPSYGGDTGELFFKNDDMGAPCLYGIRTTTSSSTTVAELLGKSSGTLEPGECYLMSLRNLRGIWVKCVDPNVDTIIECMIHPRT